MSLSLNAWLHHLAFFSRTDRQAGYASDEPQEYAIQAFRWRRKVAAR